jgi:hypothetical protein
MLLKKPIASGSFQLPAGHKPFMVLQPGEEYSCANCRFHERTDKNAHLCRAPAYEKFMGTKTLVDPETKEPLTDEEVERACSDWFEPG